jgi:hypothetical protein
MVETIILDTRNDVRHRKKSEIGPEWYRWRMVVKLNLSALTAARNGLRFALAAYLRVAVEYQLISRIEADELISEPDRAFPVFSKVEKALSSRHRQGGYLDSEIDPEPVKATDKTEKKVKVAAAARKR